VTRTVAIVDDEPLARRGVRARLNAFPDIKVVAECPDGESAVEAIHRLAPEIVFLDVQMPGMTGFDVLNAISSRPLPIVIFLTAYDSYALRAFDVHALDYLLKPIDDLRFADTVKRCLGQLSLESAGSLESRVRSLLAERQPGRFTERFAVKTGRRIVFVHADQIDWIEAAGDYAGLHVGRKTHLVRETLQNLATRLDPGRFVRIHRSSIVAADRIQELESLPNHEFRVRLADGTELRASRTYRSAFEHLLA
jgi:two-component system, LytTR family, response regulator